MSEFQCIVVHVHVVYVTQDIFTMYIILTNITNTHVHVHTERNGSKLLNVHVHL